MENDLLKKNPARRRACSAVTTPWRPMVTRFDRPPERVCTT